MSLKHFLANLSLCEKERGVWLNQTFQNTFCIFHLFKILKKKPAQSNYDFFFQNNFPLFMIPHFYLKFWTVDLLFYATAFIDPGVGYSNPVYKVKRI